MSLDVILTLKGFYVKARAPVTAAARTSKHRHTTHLLTLNARGHAHARAQLGQMGATRSDFVAKEYIERCETLQDACGHEPLSYVEALLERSLGRPVADVFSWIDPQPLGAASIGQVHRARLVDGREVAVKVQYPKVEALFRGDLRTIRAFCELAQPEHLTVLDEVERAFLTEFDYEREADALAEVAASAARAPFAHEVVVPRPVRELCRKEVLVMEYLPGSKLVDALRARATELAASRGMTLAQLRDAWAASAAAAGGEGGLPTAPRAAPGWRRAALRAALTLSDAAHNAPRRLRNALRLPHSATPALPLRTTPPPVDVESVLALLARVHAHQIFHDGLFNGDSHPGNVLMLPDGRLGMIDWGQAKRLGVTERAHLARLILALADGRKADIVRLFRACGHATQRHDDDLAYRAAVIAFDRDDREITGGLNVQAWFEKQAMEDPCTHWPDAYVMASRNTLLLRGMGIVLGRPISVAQAWRPTAEAFLRAHGEPLR
jgi:aarF domain-containing kinase